MRPLLQHIISLDVICSEGRMDGRKDGRDITLITPRCNDYIEV